MSYKVFDDKWVTAAGQSIVAGSFFNDPGAGIQLDLEERMEAHTLNGIESGCALSIDGTAVDIAAGVLWVEGRQFRPVASPIPFTGSDASDTYYLYVDPTDTADPYKKQTAAVGAGYLLLGQVAWDGASVLSALVDYGRQGLVYHEVLGNVVGAVTADEIAFWINKSERTFWIEGVSGSLETTGSAGSSTFDVKAGAAGSEASILSSGTLLTIANTDADGAVINGTEPDQNRSVSPGQKVILEVLTIATGPIDLCLIVYGRWV
jgi:hypothetical protein